MTIEEHITVLLNETVTALEPGDGKLFVDGTFGRGGLARALLGAANCHVMAIDRDPDAIAAGRQFEKEFEGRFELIEGKFGDMAHLLAGSSRGDVSGNVDGVALDVGVSSPQIDEPERGFSFQADGPLSMRMGRDGMTAADIVNEASEVTLTEIIRVYGEERHARRIAQAIVARRDEAPIERTAELVQVIESVVRRKPTDKIHPATRTFQALRLAVNDELGELAHGLSAAEHLLKPGGKLAVISFHSMEARIVKRFFNERAKAPPRGSRFLPETEEEPFNPQFILDRTKPIEPTSEEVARNPRARSAQLRVGTRTSAPARPLDTTTLDLPEVSIQ